MLMDDCKLAKVTAVQFSVISPEEWVCLNQYKVSYPALKCVL